MFSADANATFLRHVALSHSVDPITMTSAPKLEVDVVQGCVGVRSVSTASRSRRPILHFSVRGPGRLYARV